MKRLAFVIQRYGEGVNGGAEELCRQVAERLLGAFEVQVLTSCAKDYLTWKNHFAAGEEVLEGVRVRRFPVRRPRRVRSFGRFSRRLYEGPHSFAQEADWMDRQGPDVPGLYDHIRGNRDNFDLFVFFTYLYPPTFFGLPLVAEKGLLVPCAHDEPPLKLGLFRGLFHLPRGMIFNTEGERRFVHDTFGNGYIPWTIGGAGVTLREPAASAPDAGRFLLYLGRVDVEKGCRELFDFFERHARAHPSPLKLLLAGEVKMKVPSAPNIVPLGFVGEEQKRFLLANALALVVPSLHESLSLVALESWAAGTPVLARDGSPVLVEHLERSGGGWLYGDSESFSRSVTALAGRREEAAERGGRGRQYVARHYSWEKVLERYVDFLRRMAGLAGEKGAHRH